MPFSLHRFVTAQDSIIDEVRAELLEGRKRSHWMWFVFPQIAGLGSSPTAQAYAIAGLGEAQAYLAHPVLGARLTECTRLMLGWAGERSSTAILGPVDALKFCSSMTLFEVAALECGDRADLFAHALDAFNQGRRDELTLRLLEPLHRHAGNLGTRRRVP